MNPSKRVNVLYAEDDEDCGFMLFTWLGLSEIDVSLVRSAKNAFESAQNEEFDLFLLDSRFPEESGLDLCKRLKALKPLTPIVFYSGEAYETDKLKGLAAGADAYLVKPNFEAVVPTILQLVGHPSLN